MAVDRVAQALQVFQIRRFPRKMLDRPVLRPHLIAEIRHGRTNYMTICQEYQFTPEEYQEFRRQVNRRIVEKLSQFEEKHT